MFLLTLVVVATVAAAQTTPPNAVAGGATTVSAGNGVQVDEPPGWTGQGDVALFRSRSGSALYSAFFRRPAKADALPYAILEAFPYPNRSANVTAAEEQAFGDQLASFYVTSVAPPARSDTPAGWKRSTVSTVDLDPSNRRFTFDVTIDYADRPSAYHVHVAGVFGAQEIYVLSVWSDAVTYAAHKPELMTLRDGFRLTNPGAMPMSIMDRLLHFARVAGLLVVIAIVAVQLYVLWRERRDRAADEA